MDKSPDAFRTISEVAEWLGVQTHVLRFWESKFSQVKPVKRAGGRRYYRPSDMALLGGIRKLLHDDGMTIKGVQKLLREEGVSHVSSFSQSIDVKEESETQVAENVVRFKARPEERDNAEDGAATPPETPASAEPVAEDPVVEEAAPPVEPTPTPAETESQTEFELDAAPEDPEEASTPEVATAPADDPAPEAEVAEPPAEVPSPLPSFLTQPMGGATPQPEPVKPRIVDAPDPPPEAEIAVLPGALSRVAGLHSLPDDLARSMLPLVGRLAALRDRLAGTGH